MVSRQPVSGRQRATHGEKVSPARVLASHFATASAPPVDPNGIFQTALSLNLKSRVYEKQLFDNGRRHPYGRRDHLPGTKQNLDWAGFELSCRSFQKKREQKNRHKPALHRLMLNKLVDFFRVR